MSEKEVWRPHVTVAAVIERDGRFLLVEERSNGQIVYNQPAGHLEPNESLTAAVIRETLEESAWHFVPTSLIGIYHYTFQHTGVTYQRFCFTGSCQDYEPNRALDQDILRTVWLTRDELAAQPEKLRSPMVLRCIDDYLKGIRHSLDLLVEI